MCAHGFWQISVVLSLKRLAGSVGLGEARGTNANEKLMLPVLLKVVITSDAEAG